MIKYLVLACIVLLQGVVAAQEPGPVMVALPFDSDEKSARAAADLHGAFSNQVLEKYNFTIKNADLAKPVRLPEGLHEKEDIVRIVQAGKDAGASYILLGRASSYPEGASAEIYVVSADGKKILYKTGCSFTGTDAPKAADILSGRISLFLKKTPILRVNECAASRGDSSEKIALSWERTKDTNQYAVYRSYFEQGPFTHVASVEGTSYDDADAEPGLQYWYALGPVVDSVPCEPGKASPGYRRADPPRGQDIDRLIRERTKPVPVVRNDTEKKKAASYETFLKGYYKNPVELSIVLNIIKSYVKKGAVTVLDGFDRYDINLERREIMLVDERYRYAVLFTSTRLIRIFYEAQMKNPEPETKKDLTDILVKNMIAFCVFREERAITDGDNRTRYVPCYDAIGVATELHRNCRDWKKHTMIFGTGNKDLEEKIKQARKKGE